MNSLSFKPADKKKFPYGNINSARPVTPSKGGVLQKPQKK